MTDVHQWGKINLSALISGFFAITSFFVSDFCQLPCRDFLQFFPLFLRCCLCIWYFLMLEASEWICAQDFHEFSNSSLLQQCDLDEVCVQHLVALVSCIRRHRQHKRILSFVSQYCGGFLHCSSSVFCKALLLASELPTFYERLPLTMTMTHSKKSRIHRMKAWPYRQECRDHGPTKKNLFYW